MPHPWHTRGAVRGVVGGESPTPSNPPRGASSQLHGNEMSPPRNPQPPTISTMLPSPMCKQSTSFPYAPPLGLLVEGLCGHLGSGGWDCGVRLDTSPPKDGCKGPGAKGPSTNRVTGKGRGYSRKVNAAKRKQRGKVRWVLLDEAGGKGRGIPPNCGHPVVMHGVVVCGVWCVVLVWVCAALV